MKTEYLYGEFKILSKSKISKDQGDEFITVTYRAGNKIIETTLWREQGTDVWYDEHSNEARLTVKRKKIRPSSPFYD